MFQASEGSLERLFWTDVAETLEREISQAVKRMKRSIAFSTRTPPLTRSIEAVSPDVSMADSTFLQTTFQTQYPKLVQRLAAMNARLRAFVAASITGASALPPLLGDSSAGQRAECVLDRTNAWRAARRLMAIE